MSGGVDESVEDGATGYVVPSGDVDTLADRLGRLLDSTELRVLLGKRGRVRYENEFTFDHMFEPTFEMYEELLGSECSETGR